MPPYLKRLSGYNFLFDFDNTITPFDVLDDIIEKFSVNDDWVVYEEAWRAGEIGSKECLAKQIASVRISRRQLSGYLADIKVDPYFSGLLASLKKEGAEPAIVSDNFSFIVESILKNNGIKTIEVFANRIGFDKDRLVPFFPHQHDACPCCANCKTRHLTKYSSAGNIVVYIGDGLSDTCAAQNASLVFAKGHLLEYLRKKGVSCTAFENLGDIQRYLGEVIDNGTEDKARQKAGKA